MSFEDQGFPETFVHPAAGSSRLEPSLLAVRWREGTAEAKQGVLEEFGLAPATLGDAGHRPALRVNRTDGLWWVQRPDRAPVAAAAFEQLQANELVAWVAPAYRPAAPTGPVTAPAASPPLPTDAFLFAVDPTRLHVRSSAVEATANAEAMTAVDPSGRSRLPGYTAMAVREGTAITAAARLAGPLTERGADGAGAIRFETVPFVSPTARVAVRGDCRPPTSELTPNDPQFPAQWGLQRIQAPRAWRIARGDPAVVIAVIDEGVELGHPDLDVHPQSWNASTDAPDGSPTDNHGTPCAGIAAARTDNATGVAGVAGGCRVMAIATATWADVDIAEGLRFAADNGARVVSMSFGLYGGWDFDLIRDALQYATDRGLLLVAASGNEDMPVSRFPGSDSRTLCVGGSNRDDERRRIGDASPEQHWGASYGPDLDVVAPSLQIPSTDRLGAAGYGPGDYVPDFNGTSAATPHVAGLGALLFSLRPDLDSAEARRIVESTCDKISPNLYAYANVGTKPSGTWHEEVGYGRVNAERALLAACAGAPGTAGGGECDGCGGACLEQAPEACRGPRPVPWLPYDRCQFFYEVRLFQPRPAEAGRFQLRVTYEHCLGLVGRQQGPLLYTTTLLPGEQVSVFEFDRYRRVRSAEQRLSVQSSFRQTLSALSQARRLTSESAYVATLIDVRTRADTSVSVGGGLAGFFGAPQAAGEFSVVAETSLASGASVGRVAEQFTRNAITAAQATEAERSVVVSTFEDAEHREATRRTLRNDNQCHAVTYFVRRVHEVYQSSTRVDAVEWRVGETPWRSMDDLSDEAARIVPELPERLPRPGESVSDRRQVTVPTDGTLYEAEIAHCSSCDPYREAHLRIGLEEARLRARRACLKTELVARDAAGRPGPDLPAADARVPEAPPGG
jgi:subtilisin family serine protease